MSQVDEYYRRQRQQASEQRAELILALHALQITMLRYHYDGSGDSGMIESETLELYINGEYTDERPDGFDDFEDRALDMLYTYLPGGWEINEGSEGAITWDVTEDKITVSHGWRVIQLEEEEFTF